jgi:membrane protein DedA with SNARE-associated domain
MNPENLIQHYGAAAIFLGGMVGGPILVTLGGYFAHQHLIAPWICFLSAWAGSSLANQALFLVGRRFTSHSAVLRAADRPAAKAALNFIGRHPISYIFLYRFIMGIRSISPLMLGVSNGISTAKFGLLNVIGATLWAGAFTALGYLSGGAIAGVVARTHLTERALIMAVIGAFLCLIAWRVWRRRSTAQPIKENSDPETKLEA